MITNFGHLFAAYPDIDDVGLSGTRVDDRFYSNEHLASAFTATEDIAKLMDRVGYHSFWMAEHHFQREGYECTPNILLMAVHLAHLTKSIKFGSAFNIPPMWHPLRLAEDYAQADLLTGGRVIFGVGRGYHTREVEVFGAPLLDSGANRDLFEEQVEIIFKAFNEPSFSHHGKHYDIPPRVPYRGYELEEITLVPRPINLPVECWQPIVSASERGMAFMAKHGIKGMIGGGAIVGGKGETLADRWQETLAKAGRNTKRGEDLLLSYTLQLAETKEKAIHQAQPYFEEHLKMFGPLNMVADLTEEQIRATSDPAKAVLAGLPTVSDAVDSQSFLCGPPDQIIETLMGVQERYPGLEHVNVGFAIATPLSVILEQLEWFARDVIPAFKKQAAPTPAD